MHAHSQRVNRPLLSPLQNCQCSEMSESLWRSARNQRGQGPYTEQQVAFYLWVSVTSFRFDSLIRTSSQRPNEPNTHLLSAFTPAQAHLSFAALSFFKKIEPSLAVSVSRPLFKYTRGTNKDHIREPQRHQQGVHRSPLRHRQTPPPRLTRPV